MSAVMAPGAAGLTRLRVRVARSASRLRKLWAGRPSGVRFVPALARAACERRAGSTGEARAAAAVSSSWKGIGASARRMCHSTW